MKSRISVLLLLCAASSLGHAAAQRTFVRSDGVDTNPCTITQPCRGFARALTQTLAGGEIIVQDSAGYGAVTIAQSVSIIAPAGIYAGISVSAGDGIVINGATIRVVLRGLAITGLGGLNGIYVIEADDVDISHCDISRMTNTGLQTAASGRLHVRDCVFHHNGHGIVQTAGSSATYERVVVQQSVADGILVDASTSLLIGSTIEGNGIGSSGISAVNGSYVTVRDSVVQQNKGSGISAVDGRLRVSTSHIAVNGAEGVYLGGAAQAWLTDNTIYDNGQHTVVAGEVCACAAGVRVALSGNTMTEPSGGNSVYGPSATAVSFGNNSLAGLINVTTTVTYPQQ